MTNIDLKEYYKSFFPVEDFCKFLSLHEPLINREFSFVINDLYSRYRSYPSYKELMVDLREKVPQKIDIGPVYNQNPKQRQNLVPKAKEICIDIDISDYDNIRDCCKGAQTCSKCWKLMHAAIDILNYEVSNLFGFQKIFWVFSGRRGIHGWIYDSQVIKYTHEERSAVAEFLNIIVKNDENASVNLQSVKVNPVFTDDSELFKKAEKWFLDLAIDMNWFSSYKIYNYIPEEYRKEIIEKINGQTENSAWTEIKKYLIDKKQKKIILNIVYTFVYPRLDVEVSKTTHHLLKSPFSIHPSTGKVCVVLKKDEELNFLPENAPDLQKLVSGDSSTVNKFNESVNAFKNYINITK